MISAGPHAGAMTPREENSLQQRKDEEIFSLVANGDCSAMRPDQRTRYYIMRCEAAGVDPRVQPFAFIKLNGKLVLYALKAATDQLTMKHRLTFSVNEAKTENEVYAVYGTAGNGERSVDDVGAVPIAGLKGEALANAMMKALTKCRRRAVLSWTGLGMPDESEVENASGRVPQTTIARQAVPVTSVAGSVAVASPVESTGDDLAPSAAAEETPQGEEVRTPPSDPSPAGASAFDTILQELLLTVPGDLGRATRLGISKKVVTAQKEGSLNQAQVDMLRAAYKQKEESR